MATLEDSNLKLDRSGDGYKFQSAHSSWNAFKAGYKSSNIKIEPVAYRHYHEDGWEYYDAPTGEDCKYCEPLYAKDKS